MDGNGGIRWDDDAPAPGASNAPQTTLTRPSAGIMWDDERPKPPAPAADTTGHSTVGDLARSGWGALAGGAGETVQALGDVGQKAGIGPADQPNVLQRTGKAMEAYGEREQQNVSPAFKEKTSQSILTRKGFNPTNIANKTINTITGMAPALVGTMAAGAVGGPAGAIGAGATLFGLQGEAGGRNAGEAQVDALSDEQLAAVQRYQALLQSGSAPDAARAQLKEEVANRQAAVSGGFGAALGLAGEIPGVNAVSKAVASKLTRGVGRVAGPGAALSSRTGARIVGKGVGEGVGFAGINTAGQIASNVSNQVPTPTFEGVPEAAASGLAPGFVLGAGRRGLQAMLKRPAPAVPYPDAQPGSLSDAANTLHRTAAPAQPERAAEAKGEGVSVRMPPPPAPWVNADTGEVTTPNDNQVLAAMHALRDQFEAQKQAGNNPKVSQPQTAAAWGISSQRFGALWKQMNAERRKGVTTRDAETRATQEPQAPPLENPADNLRALNAAADARLREHEGEAGRIGESLADVRARIEAKKQQRSDEQSAVEPTESVGAGGDLHARVAPPFDVPGTMGEGEAAKNGAVANGTSDASAKSQEGLKPQLSAPRTLAPDALDKILRAWRENQGEPDAKDAATIAQMYRVPIEDVKAARDRLRENTRAGKPSRAAADAAATQAEHEALNAKPDDAPLAEGVPAATARQAAAPEPAGTETPLGAPAKQIFEAKAGDRVGAGQVVSVHARLKDAKAAAAQDDNRRVMPWLDKAGKSRWTVVDAAEPSLQNWKRKGANSWQGASSSGRYTAEAVRLLDGSYRVRVVDTGGDRAAVEHGLAGEKFQDVAARAMQRLQPAGAKPVGAAKPGVEAAARAAATHPESEKRPTPDQQAAGNYPSGHVNLHRLDVTIQVPKGGMRRGTDAKGKLWERAVSDHYGHIRRTEGADGEQVDVYLGPHAEDPNAKVHVIDQVKPGSKDFDEHKAMIGYDSGSAARRAYAANFPKGLKTFGGIREMSMPEFKEWVKNGDTTKPVSAAMGSPYGPAETAQRARATQVARDRHATQQARNKKLSDIETDQVPGRRGEPLVHMGTAKTVDGKYVHILHANMRDGDFGEPWSSKEYATRGEARAGALDRIAHNVDTKNTSADAARIRAFVAEQRAKGPAGTEAPAATSEPSAPKAEATTAKPKPTPQPSAAAQARAERHQFSVEDSARARAAQSPKGKPTPSANTIFTEDAAAKARAILKAKLGQVSSGVDPEVLQAGITLAGYHIEKGARTFVAYAKAMIEDLGDAVRPYLKSWYMGVKYDPRAAEFKDMDTAADVEAADLAKIASEKPAEAPTPGPEAKPEPVESKPENADTAANEGKADASTTGKRERANGTDVADHVVPESVRSGKPSRGVEPESQRAAGADERSVRDDGRALAAEDGPRSDVGHAGGDALVPHGTDGDVARGRGKQSAHDYRPTVAELERKGSWQDAAQRNIDIIELARKIDAEKRPATPEEQAKLAHYVGFGASEIRNALFPVVDRWVRERNPDALIFPDQVKPGRWQKLAERLAALPRDWQESILQSTQYAHYTSPAMSQSIWHALARMGFTGGRVLEPGAGKGTFGMMMPADMHASSRMTGIEFDGPTALISRLLLPEQDMLHADFTQRNLPHDFYDAAAGNPPFAPTKVLADPEYAARGFSLHDYFFAKSIDRVRPGGLLAFVTSHFTMDRKGDRARKYLADRADLVGAIRLPSTAFEQNAGTSVVTDVLFLRKRLPGEKPNGLAWGDAVGIDTPEGPATINEYFRDHPEMVLGQHRLGGGTDDEGRRINSNGRGVQYTVVSYDKSPAELDAKFAKAVEHLPKNIYSTVDAGAERLRNETAKVDFNPTVQREGVVYMGKDGTLMRVAEGVGRPLEGFKKLSANQQAWMKSYIGVRDLVRQARYSQVTDGDWEAGLKALNKAYDKHVKAHGPIRDFRWGTKKGTDEDGNPVEERYRIYKNRGLYGLDYDSSLVTALETIRDDDKIVKSKFLTERSVGAPVTREIKSTGDALAVSLDDRGVLDIPDVAERLGLSEADAIEALGDQVYKSPQGKWTLADEYLSGDVRQKLGDALEALKTDPGMQRNVEALKKVQPDPLPPSSISVKAGATWVPERYVNEFADEIGAGGVSFDPRTETWQVEGGNKRSERNAALEFGTAKRSPSELLEAVLNSRPMTIKETTRYPDGSTHTYTDHQATDAANEAMEKIRQKFQSWVWKDAERARDLVETYNQRFNNLAPRRLNGQHLTLPGVSLAFNIHPHVKDAIWRQIQTGDTYLAHAVGAGKTLEMIAGGMEQKRLGLIKKPMYVVPKHTIEQWEHDFHEAYPLANIMVADDYNFKPERRREFIAQAMLNNPDAIIITHPAFEKLGITEASVKPIRDEILREIEDALADTGKNQRVRRSQLQQQLEQVKQRFDKIVAAGKKDGTVPFEELGVDMLYVDEAHAYRKLDFTTGQQVKGIDGSGSQRALDMYIKSRYLNGQRPGRSLVFASGTPVTNTMGELYTIMRFFAPDQLAADGTNTFDAWARAYGNTKTMLEANAAGRYENVTRFAQFDNVPELMARVRQFMDVLRSNQLGALVKRPDLEGGKPNMVVVEPTKAVKDYAKKVLLPRLEASRAWKPTKDEPFNPDPVLAIISDGRFAALDPRFFGGTIAPGETSKLVEMGNRVVAEHHATKDNAYTDIDKKPEGRKGSAQIVFFNLGFGKASLANRGFDARKAFTDQLVAGGIKRGEIAWFEDAATDAKKSEIFKQVRDGRIRVLIGSAKKMGTGVNVQKRLSMLHYFDPPWYPSDVEQPHGRILRHGNQNGTVRINWYSTKAGYDQTMWGMVGRKQGFIDQAFTGDKNTRSIDDVGEASQYEQAAALASGDPRALQLAGYKQDMVRYSRLEAAHNNEQVEVATALAKERAWLPGYEKTVKQYEEAHKALGGHYLNAIDATIGNQHVDRTNELGAAVKSAFNTIASIGKDTGVRKIGTVAGQPLVVHAVMVEVARGGKKTSEVDRYELYAQVKDIRAHVMSASGPLDASQDDFGLGRKVMNALNRVGDGLDSARRELEQHRVNIRGLEKKYGAPFEHAQEMAETLKKLTALEDDLRAEGEAEAAQIRREIEGQKAAPQEGDVTIAPADAALLELPPDTPAPADEAKAVAAWTNARGQLPETAVGALTRWLGPPPGLTRPAGGAIGARGFFSVDAPNGRRARGQHPARVERLVKDATAKWSGNKPAIEVLARAEDLPDSAKRDPGYRDAQGYYDPDSKTAYLVAPNLDSPRHALRVLAHEAIGHHGVEHVVDDAFGEGAWQKVEDTVARLDASGKASKVMQSVLDETHRRYPDADPRAFAKEFLAVSADRGVRSSMLDRVVAAVRRYLRTIIPNLKLNEAELRQLLARGERFLHQGGKAGTAGAFFNARHPLGRLPGEAPVDAMADNFGFVEHRALPDEHPLLQSHARDNSPERRALRERLIGQAFEGHQPVAKGVRPIALVMGGGGGSGKSSVQRLLARRGEVPRDAVHLDPDEFKTGDPDAGRKGLPEYGAIKAAGDSRAAAVTHDESKVLYDAARERAMAGRYNVILDRTMSNPAKADAEILALKRAGYYVHHVGVTVPTHEALARSSERSQETPESRLVPAPDLIKAHRGYSAGGLRAVNARADRTDLYDNFVPRGADAVKIARGGRGRLKILDKKRYSQFRKKAHDNVEARRFQDLAAERPLEVRNERGVHPRGLEARVQPVQGRDRGGLDRRSEGSGGSGQPGEPGAVSGSEGLTGGQTATPAFKRWFAGSTAIDGDGKPLPLYHGTSADFRTFDTSARPGEAAEGAIFLTPDPKLANLFAHASAQENGGPAHVLPVYAAIRNPKIVDAADVMVEHGDRITHDPATMRKLVAEAKAEGHDGLIIKDVFEDFGRHVHDRGVEDMGMTPRDLLRTGDQYVAFESGQVKSATGNRGTFDRGNPDILFSRPDKRAAERPSDPSREPGRTVDDIEAVLRHGDPVGVKEKARGWLRGKYEDIRPALLGALQTRHLLELMDDVPALRGMSRKYGDLMRQLDADRQQLMVGAADAAEHPEDMLKKGAVTIAQEMRKFAYGRSIRNEVKPEARRLFDLMHQATIQRMDPDKAYERLTIENARGDAVPWTHEGIKARLKLLRELALQRGGDPDADREKLRDEIRYLRDLPATERNREKNWPKLQAEWQALPEEGKRLYREVRDWYSQYRDETEKALIHNIEALDVPETYRRSLVQRMRLRFEEARQEGVYFPLNRDGDYWIAFQDRAGNEGFKMFESAREFARGEKRLRAAGFQIDAKGRRDHNVRAKDAPSGTFVRQVIDALQKARVSEKVQDEVYQTFLRAMPEMSMRKHAIHRKNIAGFSEDALRAFAKNGFHGAHQLARLRHAQDMGFALEAMKVSVNNWRRGENSTDEAREPGALDVAKADALVGEMQKRHDWIMSPTDQSLANMVNSLGFIYYMGASPASAITNLTQVVQTALPVLGADHGWGKATRAVGAAWRDAARTGGNMERTFKDPEDKRAFLVMRQRGDFSKTQAHTLAGLAEGNVLQSSPAWSRVMGAVSWMFHKSEVINREATGMAAYRLARAKGKSFDDAIGYASDVIANTNFDYSAGNRPRYMQGNVQRIALQFKNYSIGMTWLFYRNMYQAMKGETPEARKAALRTVTGILGTTAILAGATGLPVYNAVKMAANAANTLWGDENEPWNFDDAFHRWLADNLGPDAARLIGEGPTNYLTGANVSSRTSMANLWIHDDDQRLEGADAYHALLETLAGPIGNITNNYYVGLEDVRRGHLWRGVERMLPTAVKNSMKAMRYVHEGVNSMRGDPIVPDVSGWQDFVQAIGFQPAAIANQYRINTALRNYTGEVQDLRTNAMNAFALAVRNGDADDRSAALRAIARFNQAHPEVAITPRTLNASLKQRAKLSQQAQNGVILNRKLALHAQQYAGAAL